MKGVINKGIQELVEERFDSGTWDLVKKAARCDEPFFAVSSDYPDEMTFSLVNAVSEISGLPVEDVLVEYGRFWASNTGRRTYPAFFKLAGSSAREFLLNMNRVHEQVTRSVARASPPQFSYDELPDGRLLMHYQSKRGLCHVLRGLIEGVGELFDEKLTVRETACVSRGDALCTMEVSFS